MTFATVNGPVLDDTKVKKFKGFQHIIGERVHVVNKAGTLLYGIVTVDNEGSIDIPDATDNVVVGLDFERKVTLLPPDIQGQDGPQLGKPMRLSRIFMEVYNTVDVKVGRARLWVRNVTDDLSKDPEPVSKLVSFRLGGYSREHLFDIIQEEPLNFTLLSTTLEVKV